MAPYDHGYGQTRSVLVVRETDGATHQTAAWMDYSPLVLGSSGVTYLAERISSAKQTHGGPIAPVAPS